MKHVPGTRVILTLGSALALGACGGAVDDPDFASTGQAVKSDPKLDEFQAHPPHRVHGAATLSPTGLSPDQIRSVYNLPSSGGNGTIAIVDAYDDPTAESDLAVFSTYYGLPACVFEKHKMSARVKADPGWALEIALDVEWAHAIAPAAKILLVEANSASGTDLLAAVDYARAQADVVAISMSWGGAEFSSEAASDDRFTSAYGAAFFAASGDNGTGPIWPSVSPKVTAVGGTTVVFNPDGTVAETAWSGSGGGDSIYEAIPDYQATFGIAGSKRKVPDVSYDANPASGFSVYDSTRYQGQKGWFKVGGTSAGAPQWAAIQSLGLSSSNASFYADAASAEAATYFRDVVSGTNGSCGTVCTASAGYDTVTGLGSPLTTVF